MEYQNRKLFYASDNPAAMVVDAALRPIVSQTAGELLPVPCLREPFKYDIGFGCVDYVFTFRGCARLSDRNIDVYFGKGSWKNVEVVKQR